jgi:hydroxymethylpyrimidine pyrophosphatase-like HAD family hydrolase
MNRQNPPKTLCISDLDGTLLNKNAELSEYTADALNDLIAKGLRFSVATARTAAKRTISATDAIFFIVNLLSS